MSERTSRGPLERLPEGFSVAVIPGRYARITSSTIDHHSVLDVYAHRHEDSVWIISDAGKTANLLAPCDCSLWEDCLVQQLADVCESLGVMFDGDCSAMTTMAYDENFNERLLVLVDAMIKGDGLRCRSESGGSNA